MIHVLVAAALFGAGIPLSKYLLGQWDEIPLAGTLYLSSGLGLHVARKILRAGEPLRRSDLPWLAGSVISGGLIAPVALLFGLRLTTGTAGALLTNLEALFTALLAVALFRGRLRPREAAAILVLVAGAALVGWDAAQAKEAVRPLLGAALVALACLAWGFDNNFTHRISGRDPLQIAGIKGLVAGSVNLALAFALGMEPPGEPGPLAGAALIGLVSYGVSLALFVIALRRLGSARTAALFGTAPLSGVAVSWALLGDRPGAATFAGGAVMIAGVAWMALQERARPGVIPT